MPTNRSHLRIIPTNRALTLITAAVLLAACNGAANNSTSGGGDDLLIPRVTGTPSAAPIPTETPHPGDSEGCDPNAGFVDDITIPDGSPLQVGETATKTWRLENTGTCVWGSTYNLVQVSGDLLTAQPHSIPVPLVRPGEMIDISVQIQLSNDAPPGSQQRASFQLRDPNGALFGTRPFVLVLVANEAGEVPTLAPGQGLGGLGTISGSVWLDYCPGGDVAVPGCVSAEDGALVANGQLDAGESRLPSITVQLYQGNCPGSGTPASTARTDGDGGYVFEGLPAGTYCIQIDPNSPGNQPHLVPGQFTYPNPQGQEAIVLGPGEHRIGINFGWDRELD